MRSPHRALSLALTLLAWLFFATTISASTALAAPSAASSTWPNAPVVDIAWRARGAQVDELVRVSPRNDDWVLQDDRRHARLARRVDDVAMLVFFEQVEGYDATRVTVAAINGLPDVGPRYFKRYVVSVDDDELERVEGRHVILPRAALIRRTVHGPDATPLREWTYVHDSRPVPDWAPAKAAADTAKRYAFPYRDHKADPVYLGPYNFFWPNKSLADSHGGWGVGPFHGGPEDWLTCPEGRANREAEMLLEFQRPIWMLDDEFRPFQPQCAYWMGRTKEHEPPQYQYTIDDWCPYAELLSRYKFADHTHLSRGTSGAAALAEWDAFAVECLGAVLNDFKTANSLKHYVGRDENGKPILHPGAAQPHPLQFPLWKKVEHANGPGSRGGDRGLAHQLRLLRWCRPYFPASELAPYEAGMRRFARRLADQYGVTHAIADQPWLEDPDGQLSSPLVPPYCTTFHQQLVTYEMHRFGGLADLAYKARNFLTPHPPSYFEVRRGEPGDTVRNRHSTADAGQDTPYFAYQAYGSLTHGVLLGYDDAASFLYEMGTRSLNGYSQDLDNIPRSLWESALR